MNTFSTDRLDSGGARLPQLHGRPPRVISLLFGNVDTDSRVLKSAATLRDAGAEVLIVGLAARGSGVPAGSGVTHNGIAVHRAADLDLTRTLPGLTSVWRRARDLRGRRNQPATVVQGTASPSIPPVSEHEAPGATTTGDHPSTIRGSLTSAVRLVQEAYMNAHRAARLVRYWTEAAVVGARFGADTVHANDANTLPAGVALRLIRGAGLVYDSHELWRHRKVQRHRVVAPYVEAVIETVGVRCSDSVVTVSSSIADWLKQRYRLRETPLLVRNIPVWSGRAPSADEGRLRELTGLGPDARIISYCGGFIRGRGLEELIAALAILPSEVHLTLLGFGEDSYVSELRVRARDLGVASRLHVLPAVPSNEVSRTLADADVGFVYLRPDVLCHLYALPNKLFESIHGGLPIVAADLPDIGEIVRGHRLGELFAPDSPTDLARAVDEVLQSPDLYREAVRQAAPTFDWREEGVRLIQAHTQAMTQSRR